MTETVDTVDRDEDGYDRWGYNRAGLLHWAHVEWPFSSPPYPVAPPDTLGHVWCSRDEEDVFVMAAHHG